MSPLLQVHLSSKVSIWRQERYLFANHICLWSKNSLDCIKMLWVSSVPFSVRFLEYHIKITNVFIEAFHYFSDSKSIYLHSIQNVRFRQQIFFVGRSLSCLTIFHLREFTNLKHHINQQHSQVRSLLWNFAVFKTQTPFDIFGLLHCPTTQSTMLQLKKYKCGDCGYSCYLKTDLERHITNVHEKVCKIWSRPFDGSKLTVQLNFKIDQLNSSVPHPLSYLRKEVQRPKTTH